ncbi:aspartyl/asparaginyl beta-hydroxylase domain-containing protein [Paucibacter sp. TC2R-5]|uniref:aspartyl/asparaginyl beta-hydroxylase domain-containing protein n=1 Tax=Paucibacter sp. TC2R-5 TaxID=2893555 RepID=UPI0021E3F91C|nr:aspartyl/asparaginyl beta-hydroxylase domain-containing protein [Paucibacter sp. TC2R-5]MCV2357835.1 aspartyl/asparaginyl beta-hydroxylase domain-containing protein [Paucibacter sp. TC2R-5]
MTNTSNSDREQTAAFTNAEFVRAQQALREGRPDQAQQAWVNILAVQPHHVPTLNAKGQQALLQRDFANAKLCFEQLTRLEPANPQAWIHLAMLFRASGDANKEEAALFEALKIDSHELMALLMRGNLMERQGRNHEAASAYEGAVAVAPPLDSMIAGLRSAVEKAKAFCLRYKQQSSEAFDRAMASSGVDLAGPELDRFRASLDLMFGRKKRYDSRPMGYFVPDLLPIEFFERSQFPWLDDLESATEQIKAEFLATLERQSGFTPYLTYSADSPLNQWAELNNSLRWSAFHLIKDGQPVEGNAEQCPLTMSLLKKVPQPEMPGRTPVAMFSLLKPRTRIPPHVGITNARLVTHLPLIVPPNCGFRVGNQIRSWQPGQAWVFDDTIEHEAWNDSDQLRVVLIFDIWHPALTPAEHRMIALMAQAQDQFLGKAGGFEL